MKSFRVHHDGVLWRLLLCCLIIGTWTDSAAASTALRGGSVDELPNHHEPWPVHRKLALAQNGTSENNEWIVVFRKGHTVIPDLSGLGQIRYVFEKALNAMVVSNISREGILYLLKHNAVLLVEQVQPVYALQNNVTQTLKDGEPWGIDRVDGVLDQKYMYAWTGKGVSVYIFDTGIQSNHDEFKGGRVTCGINLVVTEDCEDLDGHGTHVAGTVGGKTYGVAKGVNLVTVKVLNMEGVGNTALVIKGLEYVMQQKLAFPATPMIVNLSLGTGKSSTFNEAVNRAVDAGLVVIVASGNESVDACTTSPASAEKGITVGATDKLDGRPNWSNYGPCVDLHAPGVAILSANSDAKDKSKSVLKSGTSSSVPHVVGVAAMYLEWDPKLTTNEVFGFLQQDAAKKAITNILNSPNLLVSSLALRTINGTNPAPRAPMYFPTAPSSAPPSSSGVGNSSTNAPAQAPKTCGVIFVDGCNKDGDCCLKNCRDFGEFLGVNLGKRCFFF